MQYGNASSDVLPVLSGVPQGSILGPLLFLVFINDLPSSLSFVSPYLFADDTKFLGSSNAISHTQADINSLVSWCQKWNITLNMSKCIVLWVSLSSSTQTHHFSVDGVMGAELLVDVEVVDVGLSMVGESMAITFSWVRFPSSGSWSKALPSIHTLLAR